MTQTTLTIQYPEEKRFSVSDGEQHEGEEGADGETETENA